MQALCVDKISFMVDDSFKQVYVFEANHSYLSEQMNVVILIPSSLYFFNIQSKFIYITYRLQFKPHFQFAINWIVGVLVEKT